MGKLLTLESALTGQQAALAVAVKQQRKGQNELNYPNCLTVTRLCTVAWETLLAGVARLASRRTLDSKVGRQAKSA